MYKWRNHEDNVKDRSKYIWGSLKFDVQVIVSLKGNNFESHIILNFQQRIFCINKVNKKLKPV